MEKVKGLVSKVPVEVKDGIVRGVKVVGYIALSVGIGVVLSEEFRSMLSEYGWYAMYGGIVNVAISILAKVLKEKYPDLPLFRLV